MEQADSKRMHKPTQNWLGRHIASRPYLEALPWLLLKDGQTLPAPGPMRKKVQAHKLLPDLPEYVDPLKDGEAAIQNMNGNLSTLEEECSSRGKDWLKIVEQRKKEKEVLKAAGLEMADVTGNGPGNPGDPNAPKDQSKKPVAAKPKPEAKAETDDE
jgi:capsid protein